MVKSSWRLADVFGDDSDVPAYNPDAEIKLTWSPVGTRSEKEEAEIAEAEIRMGVSKKTILTRRGYDADEEAANRKEEQEATAEAMADAFNRGEVEDE